MIEKISMQDVRNQAALEHQAKIEARTIISKAEHDFTKKANVLYVHDTGSQVGWKKVGFEKIYCSMLVASIKEAHPEWKIKLVPIENVLSVGRGKEERTVDGYNLEISA